MKTAQFKKTVWDFYAKQGRHDLPWRKTKDPYKILVSEIMLQQTQVERVAPYYRKWVKEFPTVKALAAAPLSKVLTAWQGLGYNRRAKMLREAAKVIAKDGFPKTAKELEKLPGVGPYTARAVMAFAHNADEVFIETNIRTAVMHHFFPRKKSVSDAEILVILEKAHPKGKAREWYSALMDYGAHLKRSGTRLNAKTKGYTRQSKFNGSPREARGAILRALVTGPKSSSVLTGVYGPDRKGQILEQLKRLHKEGMIERTKGKYSLPH